MDSGPELNTPIPTQPDPRVDPAEVSQQRRLVIGAILGVIVILAIIIGSVVALIQPTTDTARIRDIFIIFMGLVSLLVGLALVILIIQLARLLNLLQNEIKPILESTNETISTLRGTTAFLSDNMVQPVIKANGIIAGVRQALMTIGLFRGRPNKTKSQGE